MKYYTTQADQVLDHLGSSLSGLTGAQAEERLARDGKNKLKEPEKESFITKFLNALKDPMIFLLLGAAAISTATTIYQNVALGHNESYADLFIILFVVIINTTLSLVQESKSEKAIEALMEMTAATSRILRDGEVISIKSEDLVIGDIVILEAGDAVPADCRVLESHSMKVEEAALTGESAPVDKIIEQLKAEDESKDIPLGDRVNMVYSGSVVVYGRGGAVVTATGMNTEIGKIAEAISAAEDEQTPLQKKLDALSVTLTKLVLWISSIVFVFGIVRNVFIFRSDSGVFSVALDTFIIAVALAVAAIPEGLPAVTTIILSIGVSAMSKRDALIRKLTAVETLGCTQIICSDKTGTLTQNVMTVVDARSDDISLLAKAMSLCSDAKRAKSAAAATGEPTECALVNYAHDMSLFKDELDASFPRIGEAPFDSNRKMMSTIHDEGGRVIQYTKGACEIVLERCAGYLRDGQVFPVTGEYKALVMSETAGFAGRALRVLGAAYRVYDALPASLDPSSLERDMVFIGFLGMIDPCRPEVYDAIERCRVAGIRPIMITGDQKDTAVAIAKDLKLIADASQAVEGSFLETLSDEDLLEAVERYSVYARVQPEHKTRIVMAWKAKGMVTAMTGDGVNDAPSIKAADIGIGMGITGTSVTKGVSDMVLADDNFATIVSAVEEGRRIYDNIRKVIQFQLTTNCAEIVAVFVASTLGFNVLSASHLLWVNLVTDSAPGLALGMEKAEADLMRRGPRPADEGLFSGGTGPSMVLQGVFMGLLILFSYFIGDRIENGVWSFAQSVDGMTMAFLTTNFVEMFQAFGTRSLTGSVFHMKSSNMWLWAALAWTIVLTCGVAFIPPVRVLFGLSAISFFEFCVALGLAFSVIPVFEIIKLIRRRGITPVS